MSNIDIMRAAMNSFVAPTDVIRKNLLSIEEFLKKYNRGPQPYPRQLTLLKVIFLETENFTEYDKKVIDEWLYSTKNNGEVTVPLDLYERMELLKSEGYPHFKLVINCAGRRSGKGFIGSLAAAYKLYEMVSLGNPQRRFGLPDGKALYIDILATKQSQAKDMLFSDIRDAVVNNDFLSPYIEQTSTEIQRIKTPADIVRRHEQLQSHDKNSLSDKYASLIIEPSPITSSAIRGRTSFMQFYDEFAHGLETGGKNSSAQLYEAAEPSLSSFGKHGMGYMPSSPWSETGKFYELYTLGLKLDGAGKAVSPSTFSFRAPSWELYKDYERFNKERAIILPPSEDREIAQKERENPDSFNVEYRANFAKTHNAYLKPSIVDTIFQPFPSREENKNVFNSSGKSYLQYRAHADAGRSQDNFCLAIAHSERAKDGHIHAFVDYMEVWQASDFEPDSNGVRKIDYAYILEEFKKICKRFNIYKFTMDQWNSGLFLDELKRLTTSGKLRNRYMQVGEDTATAKSNLERWETFKTAVYQGWVHAPWVEHDIYNVGRVCLLERELKFLTLKNGKKVEHPTTGLIQHDDMADAVSVVVSDLLRDDIITNGAASGDIIGGARGGYEAAQRNSADYMEQMGYGLFF